MASFWFISAPLFSHTDWGGFLKTACMVQNLGHDVTWISGEVLRQPVESARIPFVAVHNTGWLWPPPPPLDPTQLSRADAVRLRYQRALDVWLTEDLVRDAVGEFIDLAAEIGKPDVLVIDPFLSAGAFAAEALSVPLVVCGWPASQGQPRENLLPIQQILAEASQRRVKRICAHYGLEGVNFGGGATPTIVSPHLHISYFSETWHQAELSALLPQNQFVGGKPNSSQGELPQWLTAIPADQPLALVTFGTTFTGDISFFSHAAQSAAHAGFIPLVVIGWNLPPDQKEALKASLPADTRLLNWVNFDQVLPRTRLMIHHGGMGTTHAAVVHGVPQMIVPHAADQHGQARRAAQAKVGLNLTHQDVAQGRLHEGALALKKDARVQQYARDLADEFAALGGPARAAEAIAALVS